ncbi:hypothetical protein [Jiella pacifica]|uniref:Uncharacterized protein n=1 Tax=Jiella pacifica TaxID=2696469 RepID=A0A6N9T519_9HYPH|nr:hypothetical protein [Jiella pacifica]NDW06477.1 hypothetical protein [Jiella pacifica]
MAQDDDARIAAARESFTGRNLTGSQFDEAQMICGIVKRRIEKTGSFREALTDYAHAFARSERFDAVQAETVIRDMFKALNGQTMNAMREGLKERDAEIERTPSEDIHLMARSIPDRIKDGLTMPFYRAYDEAGLELSQKLGITEQTAKALMKETFQEAEGMDLYEYCKRVEEAYHRPVREAERGARKAEAFEKHHITPTL